MNSLPRLCLITDRLAVRKGTLTEAVKAALDGGVRMVQLREKDLHIRDLLALAEEMRDLTRRYGAFLFINDRLDVAICAEADGVHLPQNGLPVGGIRSVVPKGMRVGVSTHSLAEATEAEADGADFVTFGPVYETPSKAAYGKPAGLPVLKETCRSLRIPVYALGGIKAGNVREVLEAGTHGVVVISAILGQDDIQAAAHALAALVEW
ncbi:MAG: thiamine phosphate synthase [Nitrospirae bacterium]|nr:thiamine phosphate synthase [Nitrospirota bacterium]